jgi:hypothetical protein
MITPSPTEQYVSCIQVSSMYSVVEKGVGENDVQWV